MRKKITQVLPFVGTGLNSDDSLELMPAGDSPTTYANPGRQNVMVPPDNFGKLEDAWGTTLVAATDRGLGTKYMGHAVDTDRKWCYYFLTGTTGSTDTHSLIGISLEDAATVRVVMENEPELELDSSIVFKKASYIDGWVYWASGQYGAKKIHITRAMNFTAYKDLAWQSTETYNTGDKILYTDGGIYTCLNDSVSGTAPPTDIAAAGGNWELDSYAYPNTAVSGSASLLDGAFDLVELPPTDIVTGTYDDDTSRLYNNLRGKMFQFTYRWKYRNGGYSNTAPFSDLFQTPDVESYNGEVLNSFATNNVLTLVFNGGRDTEIEYTELFVRMGAELSWQYVDKIDSGTDTYLFYNDYIMEVASDDMVNKLDNYIPRETRALELLSENVLVLGGNKYGFDNIIPDVTLGVDWETVDTASLDAVRYTCVIDAVNSEYVEDYEEILQITNYNKITLNDAVSSGVVEGDILLVALYYTTFSLTLQYIVTALDEADVTVLRDSIIDAINSDSLGVTAAYASPPSGIVLTSGDFYLYTYGLDPDFLNETTSSLVFYSPSVSEQSMSKRSQFTTGAKHVFGITYFDRGMRPFAIAANGDTEIYVPTVVDAYLDGELYSSTAYEWKNSITWEIKHEAPSQAKYWQWFYAGNQNISDFWFYAIDSVALADGSTTKLEIVIEGLQTVQTEYALSQIGPYEWAKGDRLRVVTKAAAATELGALADMQVDVEILSFDVDTYTLTIPTSASADYDLDAGSLIEIYRPKTTANDDLFFAFGKIYETYVYSADVYHRGSTQDQYGTTAGAGAKGKFVEGDSYIIARAFNVAIGGAAKSKLFLAESKSYSDFYDSDWYSQGKINIRSNIGEVELNNIAISNKLIQDTGINGLCTFEYNDIVSLPDKHGQVNALRQIGNVLRVIQQRKRTSFYIGMTEFYNQDGTSNLVASSAILGNARELDGDWGTEHPETVVQVDDMLFFWDNTNRAFVQDSENGAVAISDNKMRQFFLELGDEIMTAIYLGTTYTLACDYHSVLQTLCFYYYIDGVTPKIMLYHLPSKRWVSPISGLETVTINAPTTIEIPLPTIGNYDTFNAGTPTLFSQGFTLTESKQLSSVLMGIIAKGGNPSYNIRLSVYNSSGGLPTTLIENSTNVIAASALGAPTFTFNNTSLVAGSYCMVMSYEDVVTINATDHNSVAITGNGYAGGVMATSGNGGSTWTASAYDLRMVITFAATTTTTYDVGGLIGAENRFFIVENGDLHLMSSVADRREFIGKTTKESAFVKVVGNEMPLLPKVIDTVGVISNQHTGWVVDNVTIPADASTKVDQVSLVIDADWLTREGITRAPVKRNLYTTGVYNYGKLWEGEKMRGRVVKVTFTLPTQTSGKVEIAAFEIGTTVS